MFTLEYYLVHFLLSHTIIMYNIYGRNDAPTHIQHITKIQLHSNFPLSTQTKNNQPCVTIQTFISHKFKCVVCIDPNMTSFFLKIDASTKELWEFRPTRQSLIYNLTIGEPAGSLVPKCLKKNKPKTQPPSSPIPNGNGSWVTALSD